jgi:hypothetical protein
MPHLRTEKAKTFLTKVLGSQGGLESLAPSEIPLEAIMPSHPMPQDQLDLAEQAAKKINQVEEMGPSERFALEAIIIPDKRPAIDIIDSDYIVTHSLWLHLNNAPAKGRLRQAILSIGRIELPDHPTLPYGGTGFIVGDGLLMTNRHVAQIFSSGLGVHDLVFKPGIAVGIDFLRERDRSTSRFLVVKGVAMIHPYWDMALLRVDGLSQAEPSLTLSSEDPTSLYNRDVAVIGYPAFDPRNDAAIQNTVFGGTYYVKRLQPGKLNGRRSVESYRRNVSAVTHDSSTLGGNSGSAVIDVGTGHVIGLHFAGVYLDANFAVPTSELARDSRVVDAGLNFQTKPTPDPSVSTLWWNGINTGSEASAAPPTSKANDSGPTSSSAPAGTMVTKGDTATLTIPIEITIRVAEVANQRLQAQSAKVGQEVKNEDHLAHYQADGRQEHANAAQQLPQSSAPGDTGQHQSRANSVRDERALSAGPLTFRDHFASLFQSAAAELAGSVAENRRSALEASPLEMLVPTRTGADASLILAAERVAALRTGASAAPKGSDGLASGTLEKMSLVDHAQACASLAWQLMQAKVLGDTITAKDLEAQLTGGTCDPLWAQTISEYVKYFGPSGSRREPLYVKPQEVQNRVIDIPTGAKIAIIGDWGTGAGPARRVLEQVRDKRPDVVIHLGDIYYSGTERECEVNFETVIDDVFDRAKTNLPIYTLCGNHDMYCGGIGYYGLIKRLNKAPMTQEASFFCLRTPDESWQLLGLDTGRNDYSPFSVNDVVTFVEPAEEDWHRQRIEEFRGRTILLSHHQLFSAFSQIGGRLSNNKLRAYNPQLKGTFDRLRKTGKSIPAWFWGHEHNLCIYKPYLGLQYGRCVGHSAIPVFSADGPYESLSDLTDPPDLVPNTKLSVEGDFYTHGFALLTLGPGTAVVEYFEDLDRSARQVHSEVIA